MAATTAAAMVNGFHTPSTSSKPIQLAFPMPHAPQVHINVHLTILQHCILFFLTATGAEISEGGTSMGSFVYAMPNVRIQISLQTP